MSPILSVLGLSVCALVLAPTTVTLCFVLVALLLAFIGKYAFEHSVELCFHEHFAPLVEKWEFSKRPYYLSYWTWSANLNTYINANRPSLPIEYRRDTIIASDGATLVLDWHGEHNSGPTIFILPGVSGHSYTGYIIPLVKRLAADGYCCAVHTHPGMNGAPVTNGRFTRCYDSEDTATILAHVKKIRPDLPIIAIGYSLGGAMVVKYLSQRAKSNVLCAAIIASCPWDFTQVMSHMDVKWTTARLYNTYFASIYKESIDNIGTAGGFTEDLLAQVKKAVTLKELDELIATKTWGFETVEEYYATITCDEDLKKISVPLLIIHALDDPLVPVHVVPRNIMKENPNIIYCETKKGGHVAWLSGLFPMRGLSWLDQTNVDSIEGFIEHLHPEASPKLRRVKSKVVNSEYSVPSG